MGHFHFQITAFITSRLSHHLFGFAPSQPFATDQRLYGSLPSPKGPITGSSSRSGTPWGIITAAFLHREAAHLLQNLHGFLAAVVLFALSNLLQSRENKERYSRIFLLLVFPSGFLANAVELLARLASNSVAGWSGYGASGVVYSAIGICTASAVINSCALLIRYVRSFRDPDSKDITIPELLVMAFNLALMIFAVYLVVFARDLFLNASPGIDVFAHTAGFLIGFFSALLFLARRARRKR